MRLPFSRKQAEKVCKDFQHLLGKPLDARADLCEPVSQIVIAPLDDLNKWIFIEQLAETNDWEKALSFYKPPYYDVILVARFKDKKGYYYKDLRSYCAEHDLGLTMDKYASPTDPVQKSLQRKS